MNIHEIHQYRDEKEHKMRSSGYEPANDAREHDRYSMDMFGGMHGVDPSSHGVELQ